MRWKDTCNYICQNNVVAFIFRTKDKSVNCFTDYQNTYCWSLRRLQCGWSYDTTESKINMQLNLHFLKRGTLKVLEKYTKTLSDTLD